MDANSGDTFEHTPGPWKAKRIGKTTFSDWGGWFIQTESGVGLAKVATIDDVDFGPYSKGNALLIAAAPELLEACKDVVAACNEVIDGSNNLTIAGSVMAGTAAMIRSKVEAAITKAEGR